MIKTDTKKRTYEKSYVLFDMLKLIKEENMRKTTKPAVYTIEEKNTIVKVPYRQRKGLILHSD